MKIRINKNEVGQSRITIPADDKEFVLTTSRVCQRLGEEQARRWAGKLNFQIDLSSNQSDLVNVVKALAMDHGWEIVEETK
jgi:hypothetical protein